MVKNYQQPTRDQQEAPPYEQLRENLDECLDSIEQQNEEWPEEKKREEIEKIDRQGLVNALKQRLSAKQGSQLPEEPEAAEKDETYKEVFIKLGLSTLLILMILGVALLKNQPADQVRQASAPAANTTVQATVATPPAANQQAAEVGPVAQVKDDAPLVEDDAASQQETTEPQRPAAADEGAVAVSGKAAGQTLLTMPAKGKISRAFGYGYDETWQDYRFHGGADFNLAEGAKVVAALDGTIDKIEKDKSKGSIIQIKHNDDLLTCYLGLEPKAGLKAGAQVAAGDEIGTVTQPPLFESDQKPHLHFEVNQNGKLVDPATLLELQ